MNEEQLKEHLRKMGETWPLPQDHVSYLNKMKNDLNINPKIIYDVGSCVLHWSKEANKVWPNAKIYAFEAMDSVEFLYKEQDVDYYIGVFSDVDDKEVVFYQSNVSPGGNSYYKENSWAADVYYNKDSERLLKTIKMDTAVANKNFPYPDLIKIDVQGCEVDVLRGMTNILQHCEHLIVELQHSEYNLGALLNTESIPIIESMGFELVTSLFCNNGPDGDYHFKRIK